MERQAETFLDQWAANPNRKPLVMRGARQVGKTWLVRHFASKKYEHFIELNFEKNPQLKTLFESNDPAQIIENLESSLNRTIDIERSLLFLDEIQAAPALLGSLRWFYEECPKLPVIAAGSLLEFVLDQHEFSMPVGRINYLHLEPLSFEAFLMANDKKKLCEYLRAYKMEQTIPEMIHQQLMQLMNEYVIVGGLPEAVQSWVTHRSLAKVNEVHHNLIATYRDDFSKYSGRISIERLEDVLQGIPRNLSKKFMYSHINSDVKAESLKKAFHLLCQARLCHRVSHTSANGLPLASEGRDKFFKAILLDCGLVSALLGLDLQDIKTIHDLHLINKGGLSEQLVGQLLRTVQPEYIEPKLYYWAREEKGASAEIDYIIQHGSRLVPVEVKAGRTGVLRSLHYFVANKEVEYAVRINGDSPSVTKVEAKTVSHQTAKYTLLSIPFYLTEQLPRLLDLLIV